MLSSFNQMRPARSSQRSDFENFANSANDPSEEEFLKLKALLSVGNDLHKMKTTQAMGNPVRVAESNMINDWKKLSGIK